MIRSNPTAIPLRASDIKLLQAEIDKRKIAREGGDNPASAGGTLASASGINVPSRGIGSSSAAAAAGHDKAKGGTGTGTGSGNEGDQSRQERLARTVAERIGL